MRSVSGGIRWRVQGLRHIGAACHYPSFAFFFFDFSFVERISIQL